MSEKHKSTTDEEARATCTGCLRYDGVDQCALLGLITLETRHQCFLAGYMTKHTVRPAYWPGKVPRYPAAQ